MPLRSISSDPLKRDRNSAFLRSADHHEPCKLRHDASGSSVLSSVFKNRRKSHSAVYQASLAILAFFILPNLPYWLWLSRYTPTRALINIDYIALGIVCAFIGRKIFVSLYAFISIIDAFVFVSTLYHFTPRELLYNVNYINYNPITIKDVPLFSIILAVLPMIIAIRLGYVIAHSRRSFVPCLLSVTLIIVVITDIFSGSHTFALSTHLPFYSRVQHIHVNPANSGLLAFDPASFLPDNTAPVMHQAESASRIGLNQWRGLPKRGGEKGQNFALVLVESWGQIDGSEVLTRAIAAPLLTQAITDRYNVKFGSVSFRGSTTNAELRELCGLYGSYRDLFRLSDIRCLPGMFARIGYQTTAMHGFHGDMFDRGSWWPKLGFQKRIFLDDVYNARRCGTAFPALCDADLLHLMGDQLTSPRQFVYALTINSHLPLAEAADSDGVLRCSAMPVPLQGAPCALAQVLRTALSSVAHTALRQDIKPTQFVVVGDHSPPFLGSSSQNFSMTRVPYIILTPKTSL
jgi:hypothetical protein